MTPLHKNLASGAWEKLPLSVQLANIGSKVERIIHWDQAGDDIEKGRALDRALELLDLTLAVPHLGGGTLELTRLREALCDIFVGAGEYRMSMQFLGDYFLLFALRANR